MQNFFLEQYVNLDELSLKITFRPKFKKRLKIIKSRWTSIFFYYCYVGITTFLSAVSDLFDTISFSLYFLTLFAFLLLVFCDGHDKDVGFLSCLCNEMTSQGTELDFIIQSWCTMNFVFLIFRYYRVEKVWVVHRLFFYLSF